MKNVCCELSFRVMGSRAPAVVEVSVDGADYRLCRREGGVWRLRWERSLDGEEPIVAVIRAARPTFSATSAD